MRFEIIRLDLRSSTISEDAFLCFSLLLECDAHVVIEKCVPGILRDRLANEFHRDPVFSFLMLNNAEQVQRVRMIRIHIKYPPVYLLSLVKLAGLMQLNRGAKLLGNINSREGRSHCCLSDHRRGSLEYRCGRLKFRCGRSEFGGWCVEIPIRHLEFGSRPLKVGNQDFG